MRNETIDITMVQEGLVSAVLILSLHRLAFYLLPGLKKGKCIAQSVVLVMYFW